MPYPDWAIPYIRAINEEHLRIGFTPDEMGLLAYDELPNEQTMMAILEEMRSVPSGIGARNYYLRYSADVSSWDEAVRDLKERRDQGQGPTSV